MQHFLLRCKHCGSKYTYCTYGNEDGCSMEYCGECQSAINESLDKIPKKIIKKFDYLTDIEEIFRINSIFDREKKLYDESNINLLYIQDYTVPKLYRMIEIPKDSVAEYLNKGYSIYTLLNIKGED